MQRVFLVSGAGSGIGRAIAQELAASGASVVLLGRRRQLLEQTLGLLAGPGEHTLAVADLRSAASLRAAIGECGPPYLTGVIANAGVGGENAYGEHDRWDEIVSTNLTGTYLLVNECLSLLQGARQPYRHIVIMSSILARLGVPRYTAYCASKAGLLGLMRAWAVELAGSNILVNAICPGWVETEMSVQGLRQMAEHSGRSYEEVYREQMSYVPLSKMSAPQEIAALVSFLVSPVQTSITGQVLDMNNGAIMPP